MPLLLRILLWLACTALTVTAVFLAVGFVLGSTAPMPPVAHADPTVFAAGDLTTGTTLVAAPSATPSPLRLPDAVSGTAAASNSPTAAAPHDSAGAAPSPRASASPAAGRPAGSAACPDDSGAHTVHSQGGQASIRFAPGAVCLVSALPAPGFTTQISQPDPGTLVVTFSGSSHRSQITATIAPRAQAVVRETSW